jgi:plastocyanin
MKRLQVRWALLTVVTALLVLAVAGVVWAAGESLSRTAVLSTAGEVNGSGLTLRSAAGEPVVGTVVQGSTELCSGVLCPSSLGSVQPPATVTVTVANFSFSPDPITINVGDTVVWVRAEGAHNVVSDDGVTFNSGPVSSSWTTFSHTFTAAGTFGYYCAAHGAPGGVGMAGTVIVLPSSSSADKTYLPLIDQ